MSDLLDLDDFPTTPFAGAPTSREQHVSHDTSSGLGSGERAELEAYRAAFRTIAGVCTKASGGDLEARVPMLDGGTEIAAVRDALNHLLDLTDAFVREAGASLQAAGEGRFHRAFLPNGMLGSFRDGARRVNQARTALAESGTRLADAERQRLQLADSFEHAVLAATEQVAAASTELGATAAGLTHTAQASVTEVDHATGTISTLHDSSLRIREVVTLINQVAAQTRLLALNATIEAARAGDAGRGFAVVAHEVKELAGQTAAATTRIEQEVAAVQSAAAQSGAVLGNIGNRVRDMHQEVLGIAAAVEGSNDTGLTGLAQLADMLRHEVSDFLGVLRS
jgi:methyl-accepting chemotaxis protein